MKLDDDVMTALSTLNYPDQNRAVLTSQLERSTYVRVDKALQALGAKWNRGAKAHVFPCDARERVDAAITTGEVTTDQDLGHFATPPALARRLVAMAKVERGHRALEPSAGAGNIVAELIAVGAVVVAIERDADRRRELARRHPSAQVLQLDDFMAYISAGLRYPGFDRIIMNPPFKRCGEGDHLDHARRAYSLLAPAGVMVCVLPGSVSFRADRRYSEFRAWAQDVGVISDLPDGSFRESGTGVRTVALIASARK